MEKYRPEGRVVRLQTGLGATVRRARAGGCQGTLPAASPQAGGLLGAGGSAGDRGCSHPDGWGEGALPLPAILPQVLGYGGSAGFAHGLGGTERPECGREG